MQNKFGKLKQVMVDKPVFKLADPNKPTEYKLKQQPAPGFQGASKTIAQANPRPSTEESDGGSPESRRFSQEWQSKQNDPQSVVRENEVLAAVKNPYAQTPAAQRGYATDDDPIIPYEPKMAFEKPDDDATVKANVEEILMGGDPDTIMDYLDEIGEYEMSERDTRIAHDQVYKYLVDSGMIIPEGSPDYPPRKK